MSDRVPHCWTDREEFEMEGIELYSPAYWEVWERFNDRDDVQLERRWSFTCLLEAGHDGPHEWTSDKDITVEFK